VPTGAAPASLIPVVAVVFICGLSDVLINEYLFFIYLFIVDVFKDNGLQRRSNVEAMGSLAFGSWNLLYFSEILGVSKIGIYL